MKNGSKLGYFLLLLAISNVSFGMMRMLTKKPIPTQGTPFQRMAHTTAVSTAAKTTPSFYTRIQQTVRNAWINLTTRFSKAPAIPQPIISQQSTEPLSVPINTQADQSELSTFDSHAPNASKQQAFESALKEVTQNRQKLNLNNQEKANMILCTAPGNEELAWLLKIKSHT